MRFTEINLFDVSIAPISVTGCCLGDGRSVRATPSRVSGYRTMFGIPRPLS